MLKGTDTTRAGEAEFEVSYNVFESLQEAFDYWETEGENPDEVALGIINASMKQNATQGPKGAIRKAYAEHGPDSAEFAEAVEKAQAYSDGYVIGKPRGGRLADGSTKTEVKDRVGSAVESPEFLAELNALLAKHGQK